MANRDLALEAYPPHYLTFLRQAALQEKKIPLPFNRAVSTRAQIYKMRSKMKELNHPSYSIVSKVILLIRKSTDEEGKEICHLIGLPQSEVIEAFEAAGIMPDLELDSDPLADL